MKYVFRDKTQRKQAALVCFSMFAVGLFVYAAADAFLDCAEVLRYTVPVQKAGAVFSFYDYLGKTGLLRHFTQMPPSAQRSFLFGALRCCGYTVLTVAAITHGLRNAIMNYRGISRVSTKQLKIKMEL